MRDNRVADAVRAEANMQLHDGNIDMHTVNPSIDECRDAVEEALSLWGEPELARELWIREQAEELYSELNR